MKNIEMRTRLCGPRGNLMPGQVVGPELQKKMGLDVAALLKDGYAVETNARPELLKEPEEQGVIAKARPKKKGGRDET